MKQTIDELISKYDIDNLQAFIDTCNQASINLVQRLGFQKTKFIPKADFFKGKNSDEFEFLLKRENWYEK